MKLLKKIPTYFSMHLFMTWAREASATRADCSWMILMFSGVTAAARPKERNKREFILTRLSSNQPTEGLRLPTQHSSFIHQQFGYFGLGSDNGKSLIVPTCRVKI